MNAEQLIQKGHALMHDKPEEAEKLFAQALQANPQSFDGFMGQGAALSRLKRLTEAAESFGQAARLRPTHEEALHLWAAHEELSGNGDGAVRAWQALAQAVPSRTDAWFRVALLAESQGDLEVALGAREALAAAQPSPETLADLALAQSRLGRHKEAVRSFQRAETIEPGFLAQRQVENTAYQRSRESVRS